MSSYRRLRRWVEEAPDRRSITLTSTTGPKGVAMKLSVLTEDYVKLKAALSSKDRRAGPEMKEQMAQRILQTLGH